MPYKDPERKRQWEQEHREQRNARRRMQAQVVRAGNAVGSNTAPGPGYVAQQAILLARVRKPTPSPLSDHKPQRAWKTILGWSVGIGVVLFAGWGGLKTLGPDSLGPPDNPGG